MLIMLILFIHFIGAIVFIIYDAYVGFHMRLSNATARIYALIWELILICNFLLFLNDHLKSVKESRINSTLSHRQVSTTPYR